MKLCPPLQKHLRKKVEVPRREVLECELGINIEEVVEGRDYPESEIELNLNDWKHFVKKYKITKKQKKYIFLSYWKHLSDTDIGKKCGVSQQTVEKTIRRFIDGQNTNS